MRRIRLTNFKMDALVDDEDYPELIKHTWYLSKQGYAARSYWNVEKQTTGTIYMHRLILKTPGGFDTEHIDLNKLNNQKSNLRVATRSQNMANVRRAKKEQARSQYKGVSYLDRPKLRKKWLSYIKIDYKMYYNGYYETEQEAAHIYNQFAEQVFGEFAYLNDIP